jgi:formylglycine-generating enzyme required for sulfatase activity
MLRKHKWNRFLIAIKYRLAIIRIYWLPILFFSTSIALLIFLVFYLQNNLPRLTQALNSTPKPSQVSTEDFLPTKTFIPSSTPTEKFTPTATPLSTEITDAKDVEMVLVPAGEFIMGTDNAGVGSQKPAHKVFLNDYYIDKYEVTNDRFVEFLNKNIAKISVTPNDSVKYNDNIILDMRINILDWTNPVSWDGSKFIVASEFHTHPVVVVPWYGASAYCEWREASLPTEAQWEKAARGIDGRTYPWGEGIDCSRANYDTPCNTSPVAVGSYESGKSIYGAYDMAGNVWEWVEDWFSDTVVNGTPQSDNSYFQDLRVIKGGSYLSGLDNIYSAIRVPMLPESIAMNVDDLGFRCARNINP